MNEAVKANDSCRYKLRFMVRQQKYTVKQKHVAKQNSTATVKTSLLPCSIIVTKQHTSFIQFIPLHTESTTEQESK